MQLANPQALTAWLVKGNLLGVLQIVLASNNIIGIKNKFVPLVIGNVWLVLIVNLIVQNAGEIELIEIAFVNNRSMRQI